ncbi:hypothetical protein QN277_016649 [Acacia crassicarpa]|uniref:Uncharacterized protein n=1 Tax=Acacia crassicarpa TaxID=499986 RepID=A0AAE1TAQ3_9FABA|nr:hypothetical protein QN277_016649 [Acacia crassicarpa]
MFCFEFLVGVVNVLLVAYPLELLCCYVIEYCWSLFGLDLLRTLGTKKDLAELSGRRKDNMQASLQFDILKEDY